MRYTPKRMKGKEPNHNKKRKSNKKDMIFKILALIFIILTII